MPHATTADPFRLQAVKICGTTNLEDRDLAAEMGADYFGTLVDVAYSRRTLSLDAAKRLFKSPPIPGVVLVFNARIDRVKAVVDTLNPFAVQLHGSETPEFVASLKSTLDCQVWKSLHIPPKGRGDLDLESLRLQAEEYEDSGADALLFSTVDHSGQAKGGVAQAADWGMIRGLVKDRFAPSFVAGGLNAANMSTILQTVRPNGIDLCSGVESAPGKKDRQKMADLFEMLKAYR